MVSLDFQNQMLGLIINIVPMSGVEPRHFESDFIEAFQVLSSVNNKIVLDNTLCKPTISRRCRRHLSPKRPETWVL